jgi:acyl-CoA thioester hydrolase
MARIRIDFPSRTIYSSRANVRITDLSAAEHLGFDHLVGLLNDASADFFKANGLVRAPDAPIGVIYADLAVSYRSEAFHQDALRIDIGPGDLSEKGIELVFRVWNETLDREVARARIGVVFFDYRQRRTAAVPERFRQMWTLARP